MADVAQDVPSKALRKASRAASVSVRISRRTYVALTVLVSSTSPDTRDDSVSVCSPGAVKTTSTLPAPTLFASIKAGSDASTTASEWPRPSKEREEC